MGEEIRKGEDWVLGSKTTLHLLRSNVPARLARLPRIALGLQIGIRHILSQFKKLTERVHWHAALVLDVGRNVAIAVDNQCLEIRQVLAHAGVLFQLHDSFTDNDTRLGVFGYVVAGLSIVGLVDSCRHHAGSNGSKVGKEPFRCVPPNDIQRVALTAELHRDQTLGKGVDIAAIVLPCPRGPGCIELAIDHLLLMERWLVATGLDNLVKGLHDGLGRKSRNAVLSHADFDFLTNFGREERNVAHGNNLIFTVDGLVVFVASRLPSLFRVDLGQCANAFREDPNVKVPPVDVIVGRMDALKGRTDRGGPDMKASALLLSTRQ